MILAIVYLPKDNKRKEERTSLLPSPSHRVFYNSVNQGAVSEQTTDREDYWKISLETSIGEQKKRKSDCEYFYFVEAVCDENLIMESDHGSSFSLNKFKKSKIFRLFKIKECMISCALYGLFSFASVGSSEMFPLFSATAVQYNGLGFTTAEIGNALLVAAVVLIVVQLTVMPRFIDYFGAGKTLIISTLTLAFLFPLMPSIAAVQNQYLFRLMVYTQLFLQRIFVTTAFLAVNVLLTNSVSADLQGSSNGLAMTVSSIGRMLAPTAFGSMFSWSLTNSKVAGGVEQSRHALGFPFNQYFVFFLQSLWVIFVALLCSQLPKSMDHRKNGKEQEEKEEENEEEESEESEGTSSSKVEELDEKKWKKINVRLSVLRT